MKYALVIHSRACLFSLFILFIAGNAQAAVLETVPTNPLIALLKMIAALFVVLGLLWVFSKAMRKFQVIGPNEKSGLKIISSFSLGHKEKLVVIQVGEEQLLLGVSTNQIVNLHVLPKTIDDKQHKRSDDFRKTLKAAISREVST